MRGRLAMRWQLVTDWAEIVRLGTRARGVDWSRVGVALVALVFWPALAIVAAWAGLIAAGVLRG